MFRALAELPLLKPWLEAVLPSPRLLEGETVEVEIRMAPYRQRVAQNAVVPSLLLFSLAAPLALAAWALAWPALLRIGLALGACFVLLGFLESWRHILLHEQWRFIVTDKRVIIITPDPDRRGVADAIYLKRGKIQVLDTNWSRSPLWGLFQAATGARDVMLSLTGYEFRPEGAVVKGGLLFPDVMPEDIQRLEQLIFG